MNTKIYKRQWEAPSHSGEDKVYKVSLKHTGQYVCSCPHNIFRKEECQHIRDIKAFEVKRIEAEEAWREANRYGVAVLA